MTFIPYSLHTEKRWMNTFTLKIKLIELLYSFCFELSIWVLSLSCFMVLSQYFIKQEIIQQGSIECLCMAQYLLIGLTFLVCYYLTCLLSCLHFHNSINSGNQSKIPRLFSAQWLKLSEISNTLYLLNEVTQIFQSLHSETSQFTFDRRDYVVVTMIMATCCFFWISSERGVTSSAHSRLWSLKGQRSDTNIFLI